jgi:hypothetical protein
MAACLFYFVAARSSRRKEGGDHLGIEAEAGRHYTDPIEAHRSEGFMRLSFGPYIMTFSPNFHPVLDKEHG